jgi:hypothetical protein
MSLILRGKSARVLVFSRYPAANTRMFISLICDVVQCSYLIIAYIFHNCRPILREILYTVKLHQILQKQKIIAFLRYLDDILIIYNRKQTWKWMGHISVWCMLIIRTDLERNRKCKGKHKKKCRLLGCYAVWLLWDRRFGGIWRLHHQGGKNRWTRKNVNRNCRLWRNTRCAKWAKSYRNTGTPNNASKEVGLELNIEETKCMSVSLHQNAAQNQKVKIGNPSFEYVAQVKFSETTVTIQNLIQGEIMRWLKYGNAYCHSVQHLPSTCLLSKNLKSEHKRL